MKPKVSFQCLQMTSPGPHPEPVKFSPYPHTLIFHLSGALKNQRPHATIPTTYVYLSPFLSKEFSIQFPTVKCFKLCSFSMLTAALHTHTHAVSSTCNPREQCALETYDTLQVAMLSCQLKIKVHKVTSIPVHWTQHALSLLITAKRSNASLDDGHSTTLTLSVQQIV